MKKLTVVALMLLLTAVPASAGVVFQFESHSVDGSSSPVEEMQVSAAGSFLRMDVEIGEDGKPESTLIFDGERQLMTLVDHRQRNYMVMDRETMEELGEQISGAMSQVQKQMEEAMANMPPEQRKMMEKMMKDRMPAMAAPADAPKIEFRKTSKTETVGDYHCTRWEMLNDGRKMTELCVSGWGELEIPSNTVETLKSMGQFFEETFGALAKNMPGGAPAMDNPLAEFGKLDGFPVLTREFVDGEPHTENVLTGVERKDLDAAAFEPPADYAKRDMPMPRTTR